MKLFFLSFRTKSMKPIWLQYHSPRRATRLMPITIGPYTWKDTWIATRCGEPHICWYRRCSESSALQDICTASSPSCTTGGSAGTQASIKILTQWGLFVELELALEDFVTKVTFYVINADTTYKALLGRPWLHENWVVPSTLHQCLKYTLGGKENGKTTRFPIYCIEDPARHFRIR